MDKYIHRYIYKLDEIYKLKSIFQAPPKLNVENNDISGKTTKKSLRYVAIHDRAYTNPCNFITTIEMHGGLIAKIIAIYYRNKIPSTELHADIYVYL